MKSKLKLAAILPVAMLVLSAQTSRAGSATWNLNPATGDWNTATNWTPATVPNGSADTATFDLSNITSVSLSANTEVNGIVFNAGASAFTITASPNFQLTLSGVGITNNSGTTQNFVAPVDVAFRGGIIQFISTATAGSSTMFTITGGAVIQFFNSSTASNGIFINNSGPVGVNGGLTQFFDTSTAGNGSFTSNAGAVSGAGGGFTNFHNSSTAANGTFINNGAGVTNVNGGYTSFYQTSTAASGTFTNNSATVTGASGGYTEFSDNSTASNGLFTNNGGTGSGTGGGTTGFNGNSTAGNGTFTNNGGTVSGANAGATFFSATSTAGNGTFINNGGGGGAATGFTYLADSSTAGNGTFTNNGGTISGANGGSANFVGTSSAGNAIFTNNGGTVSGAGGGGSYFYGTSTAGNAILIANAGSGGGNGGVIVFQDDSSGGTSRVEIFGNSNLNTSTHNTPGVTTGSLEGSGTVYLGANNLTVGSNNLNTTFSGMIQDGGANGTFTKVGAGILTFEGGASNDHIADTVTLSIVSSSRINLNFTGTPDTVRALIVDGVAQPAGLYGSAASGAPHQLPEFAGSGQIRVVMRPVITSPVITSPRSATATQDQLFVYQVTASGTPTSYSATPLPAGLTFDSVGGILGGTPTNPGTTQIRLTASNSFGTGMATLTLTVRPFPSSGPVIANGTSITARTGQPFSFEVFTIGGSATARLRATGLPPGFSYDPATGIISGTPTLDGSFGVTLTVTDGAVTTTSTLQLTFTSDPAIPVITSPRETALAAGQFFTYTIVAPSSNHSGTIFSLIGNLPLGLGFDAATGTISGTYNPGDQNGGALLGNVQLGTHNSSGTGTSPLSFFQAVSATAKNISTRLAVGTNDNVLIGGFIVTGNAPKEVIVRAIGPELTAYHVPGALQDPTLELRDHTGALIAYNDDWHTTHIGGLITANQLAAIQASGHAPTDHRESAMIVTLAQHTGTPTSLTGHYTTIIRGKNGTTGAALVEVFDLGTASLDVSSNAQLANISTRGLVQTGNNVMIGGFVVRGDMPATVIVRAIGPSLAQHGITNPLQDPTLELRDHNGTLIAYNDNWMNAPNKQAIINSGQAPSNNLEPAILRSLSPGNYTAIVRGKNGTSGVALVETYVLP